MDLIETLVNQALIHSENTHIQKQAENQIFNLFSSNPTQFFLCCAQIMANDKKDVIMRSSVGAVMKALIVKKTDKGQYFWDLTIVGGRQEIKDILLANLITSNIGVMKSTANVVAEIAAIEISRKEWLDIINLLAQNSMHSDINVKRASITTLGYVCEEIKTVSCNVPNEYCEQILGSLLLGLREQGDIAETSLTAIRNSIVFLGSLLENADCCNQTFQILLPYLNTDYCEKVYQILFEFGKTCYHLLGNYIGDILNKTVENIQERNGNTLLALEFWDTVGTEYLRRYDDAQELIYNKGLNVRNYIEEFHKTLLPQVMASILILSDSDKDFPEMREGAVKTLSTFVSCCGINLVEEITDGVSKVINSPDCGNRQASALLFSCLCEYPDKAYIEGCFINGFAHLYQLINDSEEIVRRNTLSGFAILAENFPNVFLKNNQIVNIFQHLIELSKSNDEDIQILSLTILISITEVLKESECIISANPDEILKSLMAIFINNLKENLNKETNEKIILLIMNIVFGTVKKPVVEMLLKYLMELYHEYTKTKMRDQGIVLNQLITIIHTCVLSLSTYVQLENDTKIKVFELTNYHIELHGCQSEGINMISAMTLSFKKDIKQDLLDRYVGYAIQGLDMPHQKDTFKAALNCLADFARSNDNRIINRLTPFFQKLVQYMHTGIEKDVKSQIIRCFGDLSLGLKNCVEGFVETLLSISDQCFQAVARLSQDPNQRQYIDDLKQAIIDMYHCLVFAQNQQSKINFHLAEHFPRIVQFIISTCQPKLKPNFEYLKLCVSLIFDSYLFYEKHPRVKEMVHQIINSNEVNCLVQILRNYKDREEVRDMMAFIDDRLKYIRR